jgi:hypothetical protein
MGLVVDGLIVAVGSPSSSIVGLYGAIMSEEMI